MRPAVKQNRYLLVTYLGRYLGTSECGLGSTPPRAIDSPRYLSILKRLDGYSLRHREPDSIRLLRGLFECRYLLPAQFEMTYCIVLRI